jgi:hypothetical protein
MKIAVFDTETAKSEYLRVIEVHKALNTCLTYPFSSIFSDEENAELSTMFDRLTEVIKNLNA